MYTDNNHCSDCLTVFQLTYKRTDALMKYEYSRAKVLNHNWKLTKKVGYCQWVRVTVPVTKFTPPAYSNGFQQRFPTDERLTIVLITAFPQSMCVFLLLVSEVITGRNKSFFRGNERRKNVRKNAQHFS
jgi:hypothetical protein